MVPLVLGAETRKLCDGDFQNGLCGRADFETVVHAVPTDPYRKISGCEDRNAISVIGGDLQVYEEVLYFFPARHA